MSASKPNFEVGSSSQLKLSFGKKTPKPGWLFISHFLHFEAFQTFHGLSRQKISSNFPLCGHIPNEKLNIVNDLVDSAKQ